MPSCPNCSAELAAEYCGTCGQRRIPPDELSARRFFRDLAGELAQLKLELKSVRSLAALFVPGRLTAAYVAGRRGRYLSPLRLYLLCAAIFFFAVPYAGFDLASMIENDRSGEMRSTTPRSCSSSRWRPERLRGCAWRSRRASPWRTA